MMTQNRSLNLLEYIVDGEDDRHHKGNGHSQHGVANRLSKDYFDTEKQAIIGATTARSFSEFELKKVCFDQNSKVQRCDLNAGFRGKKLLVQSQRSRSRSSERTEKHSEWQRPFSASYNRNKADCISPYNSNTRAKSARIPRRRPFSASNAQCSKPVKSSDRQDQQKIYESEWEELFPEDVDVDDGESSSDEQNTQNRGQPASLSRKKQLKLKVFKMDPEMYYDGKLEKKYGELEELMACDFDEQKRKMIQQHLEQMTGIDERYRNLTNGRPASAIVIPRSLSNPNRKKKPRPSTGRRANQKFVPTKHEYRNTAAGPSQSMTETDQEPAMPQTKYGVYIDRSAIKPQDQPRPESSNAGSKQTKEISEKQGNTDKKTTGTETSEVPEARDNLGVMKVDHHIKNSNNDYLKKWLKEKDKMHWRKVKEEKRKKKEEREKLIQEANEKLERKILSHRAVEGWMKEKNREMGSRMRHQIQKENEIIENYRNSLLIPQQSLLIKSIDKEDDSNLQRERRREKLYIQKGGNCERKDGVRQGFAGSATRRPPQARFMYKRPATAGNIKFSLEARGRSPAPASQNAAPEVYRFEQQKNASVIRDKRSQQFERNSKDYDDVELLESPTGVASTLRFSARRNCYSRPPPQPAISSMSPRGARYMQQSSNSIPALRQSCPFQKSPSQTSYNRQINGRRDAPANQREREEAEVCAVISSSGRFNAVVEDVFGDEDADVSRENSSVPELLHECEEDLDVWDSSESDDSDVQMMQNGIIIEEKSVTIPEETKAVYNIEESSLTDNVEMNPKESVNGDDIVQDTDVEEHFSESTATVEGAKMVNISTQQEDQQGNIVDDENELKEFVRLSCVEDVELLMEDSQNQNSRKPL